MFAHVTMKILPVKFIKAAPCSTGSNTFQKFSKRAVMKVFTAIETNALKQKKGSPT